VASTSSTVTPKAQPARPAAASKLRADLPTGTKKATRNRDGSTNSAKRSLAKCGAIANAAEKKRVILGTSGVAITRWEQASSIGSAILARMGGRQTGGGFTPAVARHPGSGTSSPPKGSPSPATPTRGRW
jgi:hypothetical protein